MRHFVKDSRLASVSCFRKILEREEELRLAGNPNRASIWILFNYTAIDDVFKSILYKIDRNNTGLDSFLVYEDMCSFGGK